ncbi:TlpA family protein disulfide reductase [Aromatoleum diolicum]|nr:TlpA disulfide reductase family protein [Aromatoleum diolicum]
MTGRAIARILAEFGCAMRAPARRLALALALGATLPAPAADLAGLSAAPVAVQLAEGSPAVVVLWTPGCMTCRKSLAEIERFVAIAAKDGVAVRTVVPAGVYDDARAMLARRGLSLPVVADENRLDASTLRILLDSPLAYAVDRDGKIVATRGGLLGVRVLEGLANAAQGGEPGPSGLSR